jgi:uncharacterized protein (TIRG00374 family)
VSASPLDGVGSLLSAPRRSSDAVAAVGGLLLLVWLLWDTGFDAVADCLARMGPSLAIAAVPYTVASFCDAIGWQAVLRTMCAGPIPFVRLWLVRLAGEAVNSAAPTGVGGEPVKALLIRGDSVSGSDATAAVLVSRTGVTVTQSLLVVGGVTALLVRIGHPWWAITVLVVLGVLTLAFGALLVRVQQKAPVQAGARLVGRLFPRLAARIADRATTIDGRLSTFYGAERRAFLVASSWHLLAWIATAAEVWLLFRLVDVPITVGDALIIEGLAQLVRATAIVVPGAVGTQEGGGVAVCVWLGLPRDAAVAVWLVRRVRELVFDAVGFGYLALTGTRVRRPSRDVVS